MASSRLKTGEIVLREWQRQTGLRETHLPVTSLEALFELCLEVASPELIDRIVLRGYDAEDNLRRISFEFQSITITSQRKDE
jgi:hypothetical protein